MITAVYLNGALGAKWGRRWRLDVETPKEVIDAIDCARPGFRQAYLELTGYVFRVRVGKAAIRRGQEERLGMKHGGKSISITPVLEAHANTKGIVTTILGVVLFLADVFVFHTGYLAGLGLSLALSGVAQLLSPAPNTDITNEPSKNKPSYQFSGPVNTVRQGGPVPVLLGGPLWIGSAVVSAGVFSKDITQGSTGSARTGGTGSSNQGPTQPATPAWFVHDEP